MASKDKANTKKRGTGGRSAKGGFDLRNVMDVISEAVFIHDAKTGAALHVNQRARQMFKFTGNARSTFKHLCIDIPPYTSKNAFDKIKKTIEEGPQQFEWLSQDCEGNRFWTEVALTKTRLSGKDVVVAVLRDIDERKRLSEALEKRIFALTRPTEGNTEVSFDDLFSLDEIQRSQDLFAEAMGVASIITKPDGTPITRPSNFCRLCSMIRKTDKGKRNCKCSDATLGKQNIAGPTVQPCLSGGLWDAGASITAGGKHIANWLIGQVRDETQTEDNMRRYAKEIGIDEDLFISAFREVPSMDKGRFQVISQALFNFANQLSSSAFQNMQQARFISELKQAEDGLRQAHRRMTEIVDFLPDPTFAIDTKGVVITWNRAMEQMTGVGAKDIIGKGDQEYAMALYHERRPMLADLVLKNIEGADKLYTGVLEQDGKSMVAETWIGNANQGKGAYLWGKASPLYDADGNLVGAIESIRDITARKRVEEELSEREERMQSIFRATPVGIGMTINGAIHNYNDYLRAMLGYSKEELQANPPKIDLAYKDKNEFLKVRDALISQFKVGGIGTMETKWVKKDGAEIDVLISASPSKLEDWTAGVTFAAIDITERKREAEALKESEALLQGIFRAAPAGIGIAKNRTILEANQRYCEMLGYTREEIVGNNTRKLYLSDEEYQAASKMLYPKANSAMPTYHETRHVRKDGRVLDILLSMTQLNPGYPESGYAFIMQDITERKQAERELRSSQAKLRSIFQTIPAGVSLLKDRVQLDVNPKLCDLTGYTREEMIGKSARMLYPDEAEFERVGKAVYRNANRTSICTTETKFKRKDGSIIDVLLGVAAANPDDLGEGYVAAFMDITERKRAERELQASQDKLRSVFQTIPVGVTLINNRTFQDVNQKMCDITGYSREELIGKTSHMLYLNENDYQRAGRELYLNIERSGINTVEMKWRRKDGRIIDVILNLAPINPGNLEAGFTAAVMDITDRKQSERDLKASQDKLRSIFLTIPAGVMISVDRVFKDVNQKLCDIAGYSREELIDHNASMLYQSREEFERIGKVAAETIEKSGIAVIESAWKRKDGALINIIISITRINQANPEEGNIAAIMDITERKRAEEELRAREAKLQSLFRSVPAGIGINRNRMLQDCNQQLLDLTGYSREEAIGHCTKMFYFIEKEFVRVGATINPRLRENKSCTVETVWRRKDGSAVDVLLSASPLDISGGEINATFTVIDITERKRSEEAIRHLRNYLSNIIDSMPSVLVGVDPKGNVTQWNRQAAERTGIPADKALGQNLSLAYPALAAEMANIKQAISDRQAKHRPKAPMLSADGMRYEDITIYPLVANGVEGAVVRVDDVTERVRLEEMMIQSEKMLSVGGLAAGMAHEINNPLAGILMNAELVERRMLTDIPANRQAAEAAGTTLEALRLYMESRRVAEMIGHIRQSGIRAATIVQNMLSFARKSEHLQAVHSITELLDQTVELARTDYDLKRKYDFKQIEIVREYAEGLPQILCEGSKLQQVFLNILKNGAEAMSSAPEKGMQPRFLLKTWLDKDSIRLEISDNGPGMDEKTRKRVFEPFFTTKTVGEGTGLGLSVSYFIITENHGGDLSVSSAPGKGTTFHISLPIKRNSSR